MRGKKILSALLSVCLLVTWLPTVLAAAEEVTVTESGITLSKSAAWTDAGRTEAEVTAKLETAALSTATADPYDVVFVLDQGDTTQGDTLARERASLQEAMGAVLDASSASRAGLVYTDLTGKTNTSGLTDDLAALTDAVGDMTPYGTTDMDSSLKAAFAMLQAAGGSRVPSVVVLTKDDPEALLQSRQSLVTQMITLGGKFLALQYQNGTLVKAAVTESVTQTVAVEEDETASEVINRVLNLGLKVYQRVELWDVLGSDFDFASATASQGDVTISANAVIWYTPTMLSGQSATLRVKIRLKDANRSGVLPTNSQTVLSFRLPEGTDKVRQMTSPTLEREGYTLTYAPGTGTTGAVPVDENVYMTSANVQVRTPDGLSRPSWTFGGWKITACQDVSRIGEIHQPGTYLTMPAGDVTLTALWGRLTVEKNSGEVVNPDPDTPVNPDKPLDPDPDTPGATGPLLTSWEQGSRTDFHADEYREKIESVVFLPVRPTTTITPAEDGSGEVTLTDIEGVVKAWDVSDPSVPRQSVIAYVGQTAAGSNALYIFGDDTGVIANPNSAYLFDNFPALKEVKWKNDIFGTACLDTSRVTTMHQMFADCPALETLNLSGWDTSHVTDFTGMFSIAQASKPQLTDVNLSGWDFSSAQAGALDGMFAGEKNLQTLSLSGWEKTVTAAQLGEGENTGLLRDLSGIKLTIRVSDKSDAQSPLIQYLTSQRHLYVTLSDDSDGGAVELTAQRLTAALPAGATSRAAEVQDSSAVQKDTIIPYRVTVRYEGDEGLVSPALTLTDILPSDLGLKYEEKDDHLVATIYASDSVRTDPTDGGPTDGGVTDIAYDSDTGTITVWAQSLPAGAEFYMDVTCQVNDDVARDYYNTATVASSQSIDTSNTVYFHTGGTAKEGVPVTFAFTGAVPSDAATPAMSGFYVGGSYDYPAGCVPSQLQASHFTASNGYTLTGWEVYWQSADGEWVQQTDSTILSRYANQIYVDAQPVKLVGKWMAPMVNVAYRYSGDTPAQAPALPVAQTYQQGTPVQIDQVAAAVGEYDFMGWVPTLTLFDGSIYAYEAYDPTADEYIYHNPDTGAAFSISPTSGNLDTASLPAGATVTFVGQWSQRSYSVTYQYVGTVPTDVSVLPQTYAYTAGENVTVAAPATSASCLFNGWYTNTDGVTLQQNGTAVTFTMPSGDVNLYGFFAKAAYTVNYAWTGAPGGATPPSDLHTYSAGVDYRPNAVATVSGYAFSGWSVFVERAGQWVVDAALTAALTTQGSFALPASNVQLRGNWTPGPTSTDRYQVSYDWSNAPDGMTPPTDTNAYMAGGAYHPGAVPTVEGYSFSGWTVCVEKNGAWEPDSDLTETLRTYGYFAIPNSNVQLQGRWMAATVGENTYQVSYAWSDAPAGAALPPDGVAAANSVYHLASVAGVEGYAFSGWTAYVQKNGKWMMDSTLTAAIAADRAFTMPQTGVRLVGAWIQDATSTKRYNVQYSWTGAPAGAQLPTNEGLYAPGAVFAPGDTAAVEGYTFSGWTAYVEQNGLWTVDSSLTHMLDVNGSFMMPGANVWLSGNWTEGGTAARAYPVSYAWTGAPEGAVLPANGGTFAQGSAFTPSAVAGVEGYRFSGWTVYTQGASGALQIDQALTAAYTTGGSFFVPGAGVVLQGSWTKDEGANNAYTVTYSWSNAPNGVNAPTDNATYAAGSACQAAAVSPVSGYTFSGWRVYVQKDGVWTMDQARTESIASSGAFTLPASSVRLVGSWAQSSTGGGDSGGGSSGGGGGGGTTVTASSTLTVKKVWSDHDSPDRPTSVTVQLYKDGAASGSAVTLNSANSWSYTWSNLVASSAWSVEELRVPEGYTSSSATVTTTVDGANGSVVTITNTMSGASLPTLNTKDHFAYIIGYSDGTIRPNASITRAQVVTIFFRLLTDEARTANWSTSNSYSDVTGNLWYNNAVSTMEKSGIVSGYTDGTFQGNRPITRAQFATLIARFSGEKYTGANKFTDISGSWAASSINLAAEQGWVSGYSDGTFRPNQYITRAEAITIINRLLGRDQIESMLSGGAMWWDNPMNAWHYAAIQEATNGHLYQRREDGKESWTALEPARDWAALEKQWSTAASGK